MNSHLLVWKIFSKDNIIYYKDTKTEDKCNSIFKHQVSIQPCNHIVNILKPFQKYSKSFCAHYMVADPDPRP